MTTEQRSETASTSPTAGEPPPFREPETVVREWVSHYQTQFPGQWPTVRWLTTKTRLGKSVVYNILSTLRKV